MPLFIPVLLMGGSALIGALGIKKGYNGVSNIKEAKALGEQAEARYNRHLRMVEAARSSVNQVAGTYGRLVLETRTETIGGLVRFLQRLSKRAGIDAAVLLEAVDVRGEVLADFEAQSLEAASTLKGLLSAGIASAGAMSATYSAVGLVGVAGTGTAISGLSGAAATNATLAWLGGGSLAAGGWGMAGGMVVLGGIVAAPALAISGFVLASQGEKALTRAADYAADVDRAINSMDTAVAMMRRIERRIGELDELVRQLRSRIAAELTAMQQHRDGFSLQIAAHREQLRLTMQLAKALSDVMKVPVLDGQGGLNAETMTIIARYRSMAATSN